MSCRGALIRTAVLVALMVLTAGCGNGDPSPQQGATSSTSEAPEPLGEEQISRAHFETWPFIDLVGSGTLACEDDGAITFTPPSGGDTYAVNALAQEAGYSDIKAISCDPAAGNRLGCPEDPTLDPILEHGVTLCQPEVRTDAAEPAS